MSFSYNPKDAVNLIPDGDYDAQVLEVEEQTSKAGNPMLKLTVRVWANGGTFQLSEYIVSPSTIYKLKRLAVAVGLGAEFETGSLDPKMLIGKNFVASVKTKKDTTGKYDDANVITKYTATREPGSDDLAPVPSDDNLNF